MKNKKIEDFGEKFGGARKDLWGKIEYTKEDFEKLNNIEKSEFAKKDNVWPKEDYQKMIEEGVPQVVAFWKYSLRKSISNNPKTSDVKEYFDFVTLMKKYSDNIKETSDIISLFEKIKSDNLIKYKNQIGRRSYYDVLKFESYFRNKTFKLFTYHNEYFISRLQREMERSSFLKKHKRSKNVSTKKNLIPPTLKHIERKGPTYLSVYTENDILNDIKLRGGEFGNWVNNKERLTHLKMCYEAFADLSRALDIPINEVSIDKLGIAFGSRGKSSALAHYEFSKHVINLTKKRGAGSLAHEYGHALNGYICNKNGMTQLKYAFNDEPLRDIYMAMKYNPVTKTESTFYANAKKLDNTYRVSSNGYWNSNVEMFARCFACYVNDKLKAKNMKNDYLCGHAEGELIAPHNEDRVRINQAFDNLFENLKKDGYFTDKKYSDYIDNTVTEISEVDNYNDVELTVGQGGQIGFVI